MKIFWPSDQAAFYSLPARSFAKSAGAVALLALLTLVIYRYRATKYPVVGWCFFGLALLPVCGIVQIGGVAIADRFAYFPSIGIFVVVISTSGFLLERYRVPQLLPVIACALV